MLARWFPLLLDLRFYRKEWLSRDLIAGLSVAAVQIPTAMAYADMAGFPPQVGLYASMLPVMVYALFSSSRQLVVGPDAATCAMIAALLIPIAHGDPAHYLQLMAGLTITTGLLMVIGGFTHMGFFVNFFSRPVLIGYLNGIALSIIAGQLGKLLGITVASHDFGTSLLELAEQLEQARPVTLTLGLVTLVLIVVIARRVPRAPAALIALTFATLAAYFFSLAAHDVALVGSMPSSLPTFSLPGLGYHGIQTIFMDAVALLVVSFSSGMLTARSFAARNNYSINADQEMRAVGFANMASGLFGGFAVTGADSRTAVNNASGGKTQMVSVVAALAVAGVVLFLSHPLGYLPVTALAAVLIFSAWGLLDIVALKQLFGMSRFEFGLSLLTTIGVLSIGVLPGVVLAILLALIHVLKKIYQPSDAILGLVADMDGYNDIAYSPGAKTIPGLLIYRFDGPLLFFNADLFRSRIHELIQRTVPPPRFFLLSMEAITQLDVTGVQALYQVHDELKRNGISLLLARPKLYYRDFARATHAMDILGRDNIFPSIRSAVLTAQARQQAEALLQSGAPASPAPKAGEGG